MLNKNSIATFIIHGKETISLHVSDIRKLVDMYKRQVSDEAELSAGCTITVQQEYHGPETDRLIELLDKATL